ncbi:hypothetical protein EZS27_035490 [termite gut metagenome]|uniref:DUF4465 domain-containing protein n=1 Tax=termite gut metagenome TaxID=433724 RepID=A0A5J4PZS9_9ZZZZ
MKKLHLLWVFVSVFIFYGCQKDDEKAIIVINFEGMLDGPEQEFIADDANLVNGWLYITTFMDPSKVLKFEHYHSYHPYTNDYLFNGFTFTNKTDITKSGILNVTGKGHSGSIYLSVYPDEWNPSRIENLKTDKYKFAGMWVTNSTVAYLAMKDGDDGFDPPLVKGPFTVGDYFILATIGYDDDNKSIGNVNFYLADFLRSEKSYIVDTWVWMDLTPLASAKYIEFEMSSTDNNNGYMNTPSYFCIDDITLVEN